MIPNKAAMDDPGKKAVVLLSGGLDSATVLAEAKSQGFSVYALTVLYGQRHIIEREAAKAVGNALGATRHLELEVNLHAFGGSSLVGDGEIPKDRPDDAIAQGIPSTYVPARNTVMLSAGAGVGRGAGGVRHLRGRQLRRLLGLPRLPPRVPRSVRDAGQPRHQGGRRGNGSVPRPRPPACG